LDRELRLVELLDGFAAAHDRGQRLAAKARFPLGKDRLVLDLRIDAETVGRHIRGGENPDKALFPPKALEVAEPEARAMVRRADRPQPERVARHAVGAELLAAVELGDAVDLRSPR